MTTKKSSALSQRRNVPTSTSTILKKWTKRRWCGNGRTQLARSLQRKWDLRAVRKRNDVRLFKFIIFLIINMKDDITSEWHKRSPLRTGWWVRKSKRFRSSKVGLVYFWTEFFKRLTSELYLCKDRAIRFLPSLERFDVFLRSSSGLAFIDGVKYSLPMS